MHEPNFPLCGLYEHNDGERAIVLRASGLLRVGSHPNWAIGAGARTCTCIWTMLSTAAASRCRRSPTLRFSNQGGRVAHYECSQECFQYCVQRSDCLVHTGGYACSCQCLGFEDVYTWVPNERHLLEWDAKEFCRVPGKRSRLFLRDSSVSQAAGVLMNYIITSTLAFGTISRRAARCK